MKKSWTPPSKEEALEAIGEMDENARRLYYPHEDTFSVIRAPSGNDWLACHAESDQTFQRFLDNIPERTKDKSRNKVYLVQVGEFKAGQSPDMELLRRFAELFIGFEARLLGVVALERVTDEVHKATITLPSGTQQMNVTSRINDWSRGVQLLCGDVMSLLVPIIPSDLTMVDLYPKPDWNFVFGMANLNRGIGCFSFARYHPEFGLRRYNLGSTTDLSEKQMQKFLKRSMKVMVHETIHEFGVRHCTFYNCCMNGSNHLEEADARPLELCPVDLRKLQTVVGFDVEQRYRKLLAFYQATPGFEAEEEWTRLRLRQIKS